MGDAPSLAPMTVALTLSADQVQALIDGLEGRRAATASVPAPRPPVSPYMTPAEAADYLRCPRQYVYDSMLKGRFTKKGTESRRLLLRSEVEAHADGLDFPARGGLDGRRRRAA